ncbi:hypothetical protein PR003_g19307 [Phytophthora rubi]|uniref:Uncharacterized protein n=1 Tax=Phytophthora rubi TaxID=129364 RepID=A0A6A3K539_9STRA|nr:hypothetical protein PR002_g17917 [Phytophthora rubi]KAE9002387.1 hypothetical protein PR001_g18265 [Phytophthora rubi]KAE9314217.1 hypothetical protein PR003_g19307 [Phytophthora rubi]
MAVRCAVINGGVKMPKQSLTPIQTHIVVTTYHRFANQGRVMCWTKPGEADRLLYVSIAKDLSSIYGKLPAKILDPNNDIIKWRGKKKNCKPKIREGK